MAMSGKNSSVGYNFSKHFGRFPVRRSMARRRRDSLARVLDRNGAKHLHDGNRQLAVFSFDFIGNQIAVDGLYEREDLELFFDFAKPWFDEFVNAVAIDVGANIGNHTLYFSDFFSRVLSFEPNPRTFGLLKLNAELVSNVECFQIGLSDREGQVQMEVNRGNMGASRIVSDACQNGITINLRALDELIPSDVRVGLMKLDVEGHEHAVLLGAREVIQRDHPFILVEQHIGDFRGGTCPTIDLLREYGYETFLTREWEPQVQTGLPAWLNSLVQMAAKMLFETKLTLKERTAFKPDFYPFIVAVPRWASLDRSGY